MKIDYNKTHVREQSRIGGEYGTHLPVELNFNSNTNYKH